VQQHYSDTYGADSAQAQGCWRGTIAERKVNLQIFEQMLAEQNVRVLKQHAILRVETTPWQNGRRRLAAAVFRDASGTVVQIEARIFIDASYEGDLMALAGENYHVGRESRRQYGEPMAGDAQGSGDGQVEGYNFRFVMTQVEANKRMPAASAGYQREDFVGVLQHFASGKLKKVFSPGHDGIYRAHLPLLPNGKADINDTPHAPVRLSMPDINDGYPDGDADTRRAIVQQHLDYNVGLLYFLQNGEEKGTGKKRGRGEEKGTGVVFGMVLPMRVLFSVGLGNGLSTPSPSRGQSAHTMPRFRRVDPVATIAAVPRTRPGSRRDSPGHASRADAVLDSRTATRAKQPGPNSHEFGYGCVGPIAGRRQTALRPVRNNPDRVRHRRTRRSRLLARNHGPRLPSRAAGEDPTDRVPWSFHARAGRLGQNRRSPLAASCFTTPVTTNASPEG
jgi:hypothetical protein